MRKRLRKRRKLFLYGIIFLLLALAFVAVLFLRKPSSESNQTGGENLGGTSGATHVNQVQTVPLSQEEINLVSSSLLSSEFLKALPEKYPVSITFFDFQNGERRWRTSFLFNNKGFLSTGEPEVSITLHAKYIPELNNKDFCDIVQKAKNAGDLGFYSESSTVSLLLKYSGMLKYRDCFGF